MMRVIFCLGCRLSRHYCTKIAHGAAPQTSRKLCRAPQRTARRPARRADSVLTALCSRRTILAWIQLPEKLFVVREWRHLPPMREKVRHRRQVRMTPTGSPVALRGRGTGKEEGSSAERLIRGSEQADCRAGLRHIVQIPSSTTGEWLVRTCLKDSVRIWGFPFIH